ncbi:MAG: molybdopterin-guanine dinucleotide biosynthesis protein MobB [Veillonella sp.]|nr:molybdopterin-guanine dinucleotide biosynthesis protein MobB [Veillonella sp.]
MSESTQVNSLQEVTQGLIIMAGGLSQRMGQAKALLPWQGKTLLESLLERALAAGYEDILVSLGPKDDSYALPENLRLYLDQHNQIQLVHDEERKGPLGGLAQALSHGQSETYAVVAVDMPFVDFKELRVAAKALMATDMDGNDKGRFSLNAQVDALAEAQADGTMHASTNVIEPDIAPDLNRNIEAVVFSRDNHLEPLYAVYKKTVLQSAQEALANNQLRLQAWVESFNHKVVPLSETGWQAMNVNRPKDYKLARFKALNASRQTPIISVVSATRKSGKTTAVVKLVKTLSQRGYKVGLVKSDKHGFDMDRKTLSQRGYRVGLVKSDKHGFDMDRPGSDTDQAMTAGAQAVAIAGPKEYALRVKTQEQANIYDLTQTLPDVDMVILETRSQGLAPIVEVYLPGHTDGFIAEEEDLLARIDIRHFDDKAADELVERLIIPVL